MSVLRQFNWQGGERLDVPAFRSLESSICADFDVLAGRIIAGQVPLVSNGFTLISTGITEAEQLKIRVAGGTILHPMASESGSLFQVPANRADETLTSTNTRVSGSWTPSQVNYIGVDLVRSTDESTSDLVMFLDTVSLVETPKEVPLGRTLDYVIVISTTDFAQTPTVAPLAIVTTDVNNNITNIKDARNTPWRLALGGTIPDTQNAYSWPAGRKEGTSGDPFVGGDKAITSFKQWADAVMTRSWEQGGGEYWYSPTADRNVKMTRTGAVFVSTGEHFEWDGTNLHWKGLKFLFDNSTATNNTVVNQLSDLPGLTDLLDGECIYVDVDRSTEDAALTAVKATVATLGTPVVPGSRWVIAWRTGNSIFTRDQGAALGTSLTVATTAALGTVKISATDLGFPASPTVALVDSSYGMGIMAGITRGNSAGFLPHDFAAGAGDLTVGGNEFDYNVNLTTSRSQDSIVALGAQHFGDGHNRSTLEVWNADDFAVDGTARRNRTMTLKAWNGTTSANEVAHAFYSDGAIGLRFVPGDAVALPDAGDTIKSKFYMRKNGLASPNTRDQLVIYFDTTNEVVVIAQSSAY